jgi:glucose-1-phosphate cytidylyltransferase
MKVIILCGGQGTRLREETEYKPKPMVEIGGKPILWHIMKLYAHYGYKDFILALGYKGNYIRDYFLNYYYYNNDFTLCPGKEEITVHQNNDGTDWKVTLVDTGLESMTGHRVKRCAPYINGDQFMVTYGDAVSNVNIAELVAFHQTQGTIGTLTGVYPPSRFGDLEVDGNIITAFKEKKMVYSDEHIINGGFFVFNREMLDLLPDDADCVLENEPVESLVAKRQLSVYRHKNFWQCMDTFRDFTYLNGLWKDNPLWKVWD